MQTSLVHLVDSAATFQLPLRFNGIGPAIALVFGNWHYRKSNKNTARRLSLLTFLVVAILTSPALLVMSYKEDKSECEIQKLPAAAETIFHVVNVLTVFGVAVVSLTSANVIFVVQLKMRSNRKRRGVELQLAQVSSDNQILKAKLERQKEEEINRRTYTKSIMLLTISFLVIAVLTAICGFRALNAGRKNRFSEKEFLFALINFLRILNGSLNFHFYCISGNIYRKAFMKAITNSYSAFLN